MENKSIEIEILDSNSDFIKVKLPFLDIPVEMNYQFLRPRLESGYFKVRNSEDYIRLNWDNNRKSKVRSKLTFHHNNKDIEFRSSANQI